ncbi:unnamed protein product [Meloidogyne enterolobii]|uniref:Uncharacterized protein n=1 Tax=Meloidogyne enterolobii TaxID=390850 RepID=A0ACB1B3I6_MELEN
MSEDQKIIEYEGIKYYLEDGQWYQMTPLENDKLSADIKTKKGIQINLPSENLLDVFKFLDFDQLLSFQQTSFYFKNIVDKYGKELARKKFARLEFLSKCENGEFVKIEEPHLYDFELSKQLKKKWIRGIEESIPMFLIRSGYKDVDTVVCELEQNNKGKKGYNLLFELIIDRRGTGVRNFAGIFSDEFRTLFKDFRMRDPANTILLVSTILVKICQNSKIFLTKNF